jgi:hypothetical protein
MPPFEQINADLLTQLNELRSLAANNPRVQAELDDIVSSLAGSDLATAEQFTDKLNQLRELLDEIDDCRALLPDITSEITKLEAAIETALVIPNPPQLPDFAEYATQLPQSIPLLKYLDPSLFLPARIGALVEIMVSPELTVEDIADFVAEFKQQHAGQPLAENRHLLATQLAGILNQRLQNQLSEDLTPGIDKWKQRVQESIDRKLEIFTEGREAIATTAKQLIAERGTLHAAHVALGLDSLGDDIQAELDKLAQYEQRLPFSDLTQSIALVTSQLDEISGNNLDASTHQQTLYHLIDKLNAVDIDTFEQAIRVAYAGSDGYVGQAGLDALAILQNIRDLRDEKIARITNYISSDDDYRNNKAKLKQKLTDYIAQLSLIKDEVSVEDYDRIMSILSTELANLGESDYGQVGTAIDNISSALGEIDSLTEEFRIQLSKVAPEIDRLVAEWSADAAGVYKADKDYVQAIVTALIQIDAEQSLATLTASQAVVDKIEALIDQKTDAAVQVLNGSTPDMPGIAQLLETTKEQKLAAEREALKRYLDPNQAEQFLAQTFEELESTINLISKQLTEDYKWSDLTTDLARAESFIDGILANIFFTDIDLTGISVSIIRLRRNILDKLSQLRDTVNSRKSEALKAMQVSVAEQIADLRQQLELLRQEKAAITQAKDQLEKQSTSKLAELGESVEQLTAQIRQLQESLKLANESLTQEENNSADLQTKLDQALLDLANLKKDAETARVNLLRTAAQEQQKLIDANAGLLRQLRFQEAYAKVQALWVEIENKIKVHKMTQRLIDNRGLMGRMDEATVRAIMNSDFPVTNAEIIHSYMESDPAQLMALMAELRASFEAMSSSSDSQFMDPARAILDAYSRIEQQNRQQQEIARKRSRVAEFNHVATLHLSEADFQTVWDGSSAYRLAVLPGQDSTIRIGQDVNAKFNQAAYKLKIPGLSALSRLHGSVVIGSNGAVKWINNPNVSHKNIDDTTANLADIGDVAEFKVLDFGGQTLTVRVMRLSATEYGIKLSRALAAAA